MIIIGPLNCRTDVREYVTLEHLLIDLKFDSLHDDLPDAAHEAVVRLPARQPLDLRVAADEKAVVRIRLKNQCQQRY